MPHAPLTRWLRADVVGHHRLLEDRLVRLEGDRIRWVGRPSADLAGAMAAERLEGCLAPSFVDVHCHGGGGIDVLGPGVDALAGGGPRVVAATVEALLAFAAFTASRGIGAVLPTAVSLPIPALRTWLEAVAAVRRRQRAATRDGRVPLESAILGANLEGPALADDRRGAHDRGALLAPRALQAAMDEDPATWRPVRMMTVAPEGDGGLTLVRALADRGIVVCVGHTTADAAMATAAYDAGARSTTHLFNAMAPLLHRAPGPVGVALADERAFVELIADGVHVDPLLFAPLARALGARLVLVSDAIAPAGTGDGDAMLGRLPVRVRGPEARLSDGSLAGTVVPLDSAVMQVVAAGVPLVAAVAAASTTPCRLLGARARGAIRVGARADLVVLDPGGRRLRTILGGVELPGA
jgi:N-acetylglucosamine-6-phosphate deacetylase